MIDLDLTSSVALNDQIKLGFKGLVARGALKAGDQLPSVRALAVRLRVNPNTVARALRELALEGLIESKRGNGTYVAKQAQDRARAGLEDVRAQLSESLRQARRAGLNWSEIQSALRQVKGGEDE